MSDPGCFPRGYADGSGVYAPPPEELPTGTWWVYAHGRVYRLVVPEPYDPNAVKLNNQLVKEFTYKPRVRYSNGMADEIRFVRDEPAVRQVWEGFVSSSNTSAKDRSVELDDKYRMAGIFYQQDEGSTERGLPGGWYATIDRDKTSKGKKGRG